MANLIETATQAGNFTTLVQAIETAQLTDVLNSPGPYTILAPTDEAFAQLPQEILEHLNQDPHKLQRILSYHVLQGDVRSDDLAEIDEAPTMEGSVVAVERDDNHGVHINQATVTEMDILTDNGVIHAIDTVLMPALVAVE